MKKGREYMVGIYKITNLINNKIYIGLSIDIKDRWKAHRTRPFQPNCSQYESHLYRAIRKYKLENFKFEIIEECKPDELEEKEIYWIKYYNTTNPEIGYNKTSGGEHAITFSKLTQQEVLKIQELLIKTKISQQLIAKEYNVSQRSISGINTGQTWYNEKLSYPLRKESILKQNNTIKINNNLMNTCPKCGKLKSYSALLCIDCTKKESRIIERPSREELKQLIRTLPFTQIAKKYNVSDNAIRKWCDFEKLPRTKKEINQYDDEKWDKI